MNVSRFLVVSLVSGIFVTTSGCSRIYPDHKIPNVVSNVIDFSIKNTGSEEIPTRDHSTCDTTKDIDYVIKIRLKNVLTAIGVRSDITRYVKFKLPEIITDPPGKTHTNDEEVASTDSGTDVPAPSPDPNDWNTKLDVNLGAILKPDHYVLIKIILDEDNVQFLTYPPSQFGLASKDSIFAVRSGKNNNAMFCYRSDIEYNKNDPDDQNSGKTTARQVVKIRVKYLGPSSGSVYGSLNIGLIPITKSNGTIKIIPLPIYIDPKIQNNG